MRRSFSQTRPNLQACRLKPDSWIEISVWDGFTGGTHLPPEKNDKRKHYETITVDMTIGGSFHVVDEKDGTVSPVPGS